MEPLEVPSKTGYGAAELEKCHRRYSAIAVMIALGLHFSGAGLFWEPAHSTKKDGNVVLGQLNHAARILPPVFWGPRIATVIRGGMQPHFGIPVPVPESKLAPDTTVSPNDGYKGGDPTLEPGAPGPGEPGAGWAEGPENEPPDPFVPYEKAPEAVKQVQPKYPDLATRAGLEGTVWVKIWVDKAGKPKKAVVIKSEAEIFDQPATEAAMQWIFTPALMKNGPVSVWVSVPFRFKLQGK
ncbi:MAG: energy transducer TonB [Ignavibacteriales bacterium]|nr:energy transducer TonB [Ignavibacteriales bacterium]